MTEPTDAELIAFAVETGMRVRTGKGAVSFARAVPARWGTPPAEQQAPKETLGGVNGWRDISTAPKDGSRFVATGHNYGLYSEVRHTCVAQWFRGCWMEASDWNETSELKYLTHWMPLPSPPDDVAAPAEQQAQPGAVYAELPAPTASIGTDDAWHEAAMRDFADRTHAARLRCKSEQARLATLWGYVRADAAPKAAPGEPPGIQALMCVISSLHSLRDTAHFSDEEGELTNDLCTLRDWAYAQTAAFQPAPTAQAAESVQEDAARLDWLEQNLFHREKDEWDTKYGGYKEYNMWVLFSPKGIQGSARNIIDAAREQGADHDR